MPSLGKINPATREYVLKHPIWGNSNIKVANKVIICKGVASDEPLQVQDVIDKEQKKWLTYDQFKRDFQILKYPS